MCLGTFSRRARSLATTYIFARVRILGTLVPFCAIGNSSEFPIAQKRAVCIWKTSVFQAYSSFLDLNLRPLSALESPVRQADSHDLVAHDSEPDADDSDLQHIAEQICAGWTDDRDAEC